LLQNFSKPIDNIAYALVSQAWKVTPCREAIEIK
jgi:hypothetical protein